VHSVRFYRPGYNLMITTKFVDGQRTVIARHFDNDTNQVTRFLNGVQVHWDFRDNVIRVVNTRFLRGPSARMDAYTVPTDVVGWCRNKADMLNACDSPSMS
jgi:hypothetical protein